VAKVITPMKKLRYIVLTATCGIFIVIGLAEAADATGGSTQVAPAGQQAATVQATRGKGSITIGDETRSFDVEFCNVTQSVGQGGSQALTASWRENVGCWRGQAVCFRPDPSNYRPYRIRLQLVSVFYAEKVTKSRDTNL
jgi:hypothetical protein